MKQQKVEKEERKKREREREKRKEKTRERKREEERKTKERERKKEKESEGKREEVARERIFMKFAFMSDFPKRKRLAELKCYARSDSKSKRLQTALKGKEEIKKVFFFP